MAKTNILITGSEGFIGSNLLSALKKFPEYEIFLFDKQHGDVSNFNFSFKKIDHVIHLAARTYVPDSWETPSSFYKTNFLGTVNLLDLCHLHSASLTYISAYVYGAPDYLPIDEKHPLKGANPYMHSKILAESVCKFYSENYNVPVVILRPFNVYGMEQSKNFIIPKIIDQVLSKKNEISVFSLNTKRDYIYIDDLVDAIIKSLNIDSKFCTLNIGSGKSYSTMDIIQLCQKIANTNKEVVSEGIVRKNEILDVIADIEESKKVLNWQPKFNIIDGLKKIIENAKV
jgi:UDP-glucose 4-epimerase